MRVLLVGALALETLPVCRRLGLPPRRRLSRGPWRGLELGVLRCGVGPDRARRRSEEALRGFDADLVVSFGTCGSLVGHEVGSVLRIGSVREGEGPPQTVGEGVAGVTVRRGVFDPVERDRLAGQGSEVVEMEAYAVWQAAAGRPFAALKVVSDRASSPPKLLAFALGAWRICSHALAPAIEDLVILETERLLEASKSR